MPWDTLPKMALKIASYKPTNFLVFGQDLNVYDFLNNFSNVNLKKFFFSFPSPCIKLFSEYILHSQKKSFSLILLYYSFYINIQVILLLHFFHCFNNDKIWNYNLFIF